MVIVSGLFKWGAALLIGVIAGIAISVFRLPLLPAAVVAFAGGCIAGYVSTPGNTQLADVFSLTWTGSGVMLGFVIATLALGVPIEYLVGGWAIWVMGAALVGWLVVAVPRTAQDDSFFGRLRGRWRRRP